MLIDPDNHLGLMALLFAIVGVCCWSERFAWGSRVSAPVLVILLALVLSNLGLIPREAPSYGFVSEYFVMAAVPLLLFKADLRQLAVASNACVLGPPTAAALAARSGWHELVTPGILCGIFGYLIGNFLGAGVFELLR